MKLQTTSIEAEGWNSSAPAESFQVFAGDIHDKAKKILVKDGQHSEMFFFLPLSGKGHIIIWTYTDRDLEADWLRRHISKNYIYGVVQVVEAWMHMAEKPGDHLLKQLMAGEIRVSDLKQNLRKEVLMVSAQSRDGWAKSWVDQIVRGSTGNISLGEGTEFTDFRGRFGKVFG